MGGFGSGRWKYYTKKRIVEDCWRLDLAEVLLEVPTTDPPCGVLMTTRINGLGEIPLPVHYSLLEEEDAAYLDITYPIGRKGACEHLKERIELLSTPPNYGGARWYFSCPYTSEGERCGARVRILYLPPRERRFGCRECHELTYESSQHNHKYDAMYRALAGGESEGEKYECIKGMYSYKLREARRKRARGQWGWLEDFDPDPYFEEDL